MDVIEKRFVVLFFLGILLVSVFSIGVFAASNSNVEEDNVVKEEGPQPFAFFRLFLRDVDRFFEFIKNFEFKKKSENWETIYLVDGTAYFKYDGGWKYSFDREVWQNVRNTNQAHLELELGQYAFVVDNLYGKTSYQGEKILLDIEENGGAPVEVEEHWSYLNYTVEDFFSGKISDENKKVGFLKIAVEDEVITKEQLDEAEERGIITSDQKTDAIIGAEGLWYFVKVPVNYVGNKILWVVGARTFEGEGFRTWSYILTRIGFIFVVLVFMFLFYYIQIHNTSNLNLRYLDTFYKRLRYFIRRHVIVQEILLVIYFIFSLIPILNRIMQIITLEILFSGSPWSYVVRALIWAVILYYGPSLFVSYRKASEVNIAYRDSLKDEAAKEIAKVHLRK